MTLTLRSSCVAPAPRRHSRGRLAPGESGPGGRRNRRAGYALLLLAIVTTAGCRLDMHVHPRYNPLAKSDFFSDQRTARPLVEGTVARGDERADTYFYTGKIGNNPGEYMPSPVTTEAT